MPRAIKYDDTVYEHVPMYSKIFMYISSNWDNLSPYVEILKALPRSFVTYKYGKNQDIIRYYGTHFNHSVFGLDFKLKEDYIQNIIKGVVKFIFVFTDIQEPFSINIIQLSEKYSVPMICYSNIDSVYHFYDYSTGSLERTLIDNVNDVINKLKEVHELKSFEKIVHLFPEFDIIPDIPVTTRNMERCMEKLRNVNLLESEKKKTKRIKLDKPLFDHNLSKIRKMNASRAEKKIKYDDEPPSKKNSISNFFKKK